MQNSRSPMRQLGAKHNPPHAVQKDKQMAGARAYEELDALRYRPRILATASWLADRANRRIQRVCARLGLHMEVTANPGDPWERF
jgi:hypothetical protein